MTLTEIATHYGALSAGILIGILIVALFSNANDDTTQDRMTHASNAADAELLNYLNKSECNMFFNPGMGAWGLLDGQNKMLATAHTVHACLARAMEKDAGEVVA